MPARALAEEVDEIRLALRESILNSFNNVEDGEQKVFEDIEDDEGRRERADMQIGRRVPIFKSGALLYVLVYIQQEYPLYFAQNGNHARSTTLISARYGNRRLAD